MAYTLSSPPVTDLVAFAAGAGHPDFPCLSRTHAPSSCVPCADFSPWLAERIRQGDAEAVGEYLWRLREANPGLGEPLDRLRQHYNALAARILAAPLERHLVGGDAQAYLDLRVALVLLAVHEGFSGFIMTGEAPDFLAAVMAPHALQLLHAERLVQARNEFVREMGREMSYWAAWPMLTPDGLPPLTGPDDPALRRLQDALLGLPLGARAHAVDSIRHLSAHPHVPKTLASLSRYETRKRGLEVAESSRLILESGIAEPSADIGAWLATWTRRDLLGFLAQFGVGARNSWGKERLAEVARTECAEQLRQRMAEAGVIELADQHLEAARLLRQHVEAARETWRVWLAFGTGL
ncbi:MAG TPA: hypothetical protein VJQ46_12765, partial [Gemmatimonadales bacterium]|nr:hypothetical protein [Gemmatimonadales bacterium]